jgi:CBS domain containing-hemolysin-like protein
MFVAAEFSFITVDRTRIERMARKGDRQAQGVLKGLQTLSTQLSGAQIGITITNLAIGLLAEPAIAELLKDPLSQAGITGAWLHAIAMTLAIAVATFATMVFGELVPKNLAITKPVATARFVQSTQRGFSSLLHYPILFLNGTANRILRRLHIEPQEELASARSAEELLSVVRHSAKSGALPKDTALMLERSLEFGERVAADVATPRVKVVTVDLEDKVAKILALAKDTGHSLFPVVKGNLDAVAGIVHIKDVVKVPFEDRQTVQTKQILQPAVYIPSSLELDALLQRLRANNAQMAILVDEFGGTDGIVTIEDLVEELVGEVRDEHDEQGLLITQLGEQSWLLSGLLRPDEVSETVGIELPEDEDFETLGGLLLDKLEKIPDIGDSVFLDTVDRDGDVQRIKLTVRSMDGRRVDRCILERVDSSDDEVSV